MKLGSKYNLLDNPHKLKYKQIYWSKYLQSVEWSKYGTINHYLLDAVVCKWLS